MSIFEQHPLFSLDSLHSSKSNTIPHIKHHLLNTYHCTIRFKSHLPQLLMWILKKCHPQHHSSFSSISKIYQSQQSSTVCYSANFISMLCVPFLSCTVVHLEVYFCSLLINLFCDTWPKTFWKFMCTPLMVLLSSSLTVTSFNSCYLAQLIHLTPTPSLPVLDSYYWNLSNYWC